MRLRLCGLFSFVVFALLGCSSFHSLHQNVKTIDKSFPEYSIVISNMSYQSPIVIVQLRSLDPLDVLSVDSTSRSNTLQLSAFDETHYLLFFEDLNGDFIMQSNEPSQLINVDDVRNKDQLAQPLLSVSKTEPNINVVLAQNGDQFEAPFIGVNFIFKLNIELEKAAIGQVTSLSSDTFSRQSANTGMWKPAEFIESKHAGVFFLQSYDPDKIPVLFVHGMKGTGGDFSPIIEQIDTTRYQVWLYNYPSSLSLPFLTKALSEIMKEITQRYSVDSLHLVAHSMGGLITKGYLNQCSVVKECDFIRSFTSISAPFSGVKSAEMGVKYAPVVMPAWRGLSPNSTVITTLFDVSASTMSPPHFLIFGYRLKGALNAESSDGVISLSSQLRPSAQLQAETVFGFDDDHVTILSNPNMHNQLFDFWQKQEIAIAGNLPF
ncbi:alpha/beta fold hydrolase [Photobacterium swingsii]|uniref:alpha/beta fold hydrolase n=1 Tax=Photobacterium swingsii TaxID=680026 RepID=UPI0040696A84